MTDRYGRAVTETVHPPALPPRVVFVCTGNICRSAYAEVTARAHSATPDVIEWSSAGVGALEGHGFDEVMAETLEPSEAVVKFRARQLTTALSREADLLLTFTARQRSQVLEIDPRAMRRTFLLTEFVALIDHWSDAPDFASALQIAGRQRSLAHGATDIADPFRRGPEAARAAARQIDEALTGLVPAIGRLAQHR